MCSRVSANSSFCAELSMAIEFSPLAATKFPAGGHHFSPLVAIESPRSWPSFLPGGVGARS
jgi:hypothetical protein